MPRRTVRFTSVKPITLILMLLAAVASGSLCAVEQMRVLALFSDKVMVEIDGRNRLLRAGEPSPEGVLLVSSSANEAVIEIDGKRQTYGLGSHSGGSFATPESREVQIWRDRSGSYRTVGSINGRTTDMIVDTGATSVAMSETEAKRLGIPYRLKGSKTGVSTASGHARAYSIMLDRVRVGDIELRQVEGVVIQGDAPRQVLLGMSFLKQVDMENQGAMLLLRSKF